MGYTKNYTPLGWQVGAGGGTPMTAAVMNHLETQYDEAMADILYRDATVADFQKNPATGDFDYHSELINNGLVTGEPAVAKNIGEYAEVDFGLPVTITQYRQYGKSTNNGDGEWKITYWNLASRAWVDWVTGIATRPAESWSNWASSSTVVTDKIRLICGNLDSGFTQNVIWELEVKY